MLGLGRETGSQFAGELSVPQPTERTKGREDWSRYVAFSFAAADVLIELGDDGRVVFAAGALKELSGKRVEELQGGRFLDLLSDHDRAAVASAIDNLEEGRRLTPMTIGFAAARSYVNLMGFKLPNGRGRTFLACSRTLMPSDRHGQGRRDAETGLLPKEDFADMVGEQIRLIQEDDQDAALTLFQLDDLSGLEQRVGPQETERLLGDLGSALQAYSLGGDSAGRLDDDKYGVVHTPGDGINALSSRIKELVRQVDPTGGAGVVSTTIDLAHHSLNDREAGQAVIYAINRFADSNSTDFDIHSLEQGLEDEMRDTVGRIGALKQTIGQGDFSVVYQPIVDLKTKAVHHYEALTRFPAGGSPFETITFAEKVGMISDFDLSVARKVRNLLNGEGQKAPSVHIAVNLSARSLESDAFVEALRAIMAECPKIRPSVVYEITESYKTKDLNRTNGIVQQLRQDGHQVCLDDFGAGGASFDYLQTLHVDYVKLDGIYVRRMLTERREATILESMARLCHALDMQTIAEFVETEDQAHGLRTFGVRYAQGWLFGAPAELPESAFATKAETTPMRQPVRSAPPQGCHDPVGVGGFKGA